MKLYINDYKGHFMTKYDLYDFFFRILNFLLDTNTLYKTALMHLKLGHLSRNYKVLNFLLDVNLNGNSQLLLLVLNILPNYHKLCFVIT